MNIFAKNSLSKILIISHRFLNEVPGSKLINILGVLVHTAKLVSLKSIYNQKKHMRFPTTFTGIKYHHF